MKKLFGLAVPVLLPLLFLGASSCANSQKVLYFQDIEQITALAAQSLYTTRIAKDDLLSIVVSGPNKEVTMPYNLTLSDNITSQMGTQSVIPYLVDADGNIDFPILGRLHVEGMTRLELTDYLTAEIGKDIKDPVVVVSFTDYKITVLGDVRSPGTYTMPSERTTLLQALGMAGDLNITARRDNIILIREVDGVQTHTTMDLRSADLMNSPYFYLHQNDVLYVQPGKARIVQGTNTTTIWSFAFSTITFLVSMATMVINLTSNHSAQ